MGTVERAHRAVFGTGSHKVEPYRYDVSADTSILHEYGVPALTYGPGGIRKDGVYDVYDQYGEIVSIDNLVSCTKVYAQCIAEYLRIAIQRTTGDSSRCGSSDVYRISSHLDSPCEHSGRGFVRIGL